MTRVTTIRVALPAFLSAWFLSFSVAVHAQTTDLTGDVKPVDQMMHDYFDAYARGDMVALIKFVHVPFMITGSKGFTAFTRGDEALEWYTKLYEAAVKQGYAKSHGSTWG